jgi:hypothetical protein
MSRRNVWLCTYVLLACCVLPMLGQQPTANATNASNVVVPPVMNFSGVLADVKGKALTNITGVTFFLYKEEQGGAPLWMETQNVQPDKTGHYSVMLGSTTSTGLPGDLFAAGEARWLGVQPQGQAEQPRVMLLSVPYALKAVDAETIGGLPPSAFALANTATATTGNAGGNNATARNVSKGTAQAISGSGTLGYIPEWLGASTLGNSLLFQSNAGNMGISTTAPSQKFEIDLGNILAKGTNNFRKSGDSASFYVGDTNHLVQATFGGGLTLGAYKVPQALFVQDVTGNVGIGTGAPGDALDVVGTTHIDFNQQNTGNFAPNLVFGGDGSGEGVSSTRQAGTNQWGLDFWTNHNRQISITNTGNVGIGTSTPAQKLTVAGTIQSTTGGMMFPDGTTQTTASVAPALPIIKLGRYTMSIGAGIFYTFTGYWNDYFPDSNYSLTCNLVWNDSVQYNHGSVYDLWLDHIISKATGSFTAVIVNTMPYLEYYEMDCVAMEVSGASSMHVGATKESSRVSTMATVGPDQPIGVKPQ